MPRNDPPREAVTAWRPEVPGITEVFHAHFIHHAYPSHTHDAWTLLLVDDGAVRYGLHRREHGALPASVTLLPPHVPHDGRSARPDGFRKRVVYLTEDVLDRDLVGHAVDTPDLRDPLLRRRVDRLHRVLTSPGDSLEAASRLALIRERLLTHLGPRPADLEPRRPDPRLADRLRQLLDARIPDGLSLDEAAALLGAHPAHLVRCFTRQYGMPPHRYLTGRRVDLARRLLLAGRRPAEVAALSGFYDQPHLTRHFRAAVGTTPARYANATEHRR
ncbi:helix-turn-helix domain-containing protein [Yinghuangia sp. YIM S09857]|uniref:helix-turn-helix domain-containing protein n=1 Tax=Yinghuangia sp. YIM S09857 TaxID=3436929 RepID=UPI003F52FC35